MGRLLILLAAVFSLASCSGGEGRQQSSSTERTEFSDETDRLMNRLDAGGTVSTSDYISNTSESSDVSSEQKDRYESLPQEGKDEVDRRMKEYDAACSTSSDC